MKAIKYTLLLLTSTLLITLSCRRDDDCERACTDPTNPQCPNYDPCYGAEPPSAGFTIQENYLGQQNGWDSWTPDDSVFFGRNDIRFTSPYTGSEYKHTWYLGAEVIHDASFSRDHSSVTSAQRPYQITISHVLEYPLNNDCYANATGRDSVARTYTLVRYFNDLQAFGKYRGVFENQKDSFDFEFRIEHEDGGKLEWEDSWNSVRYIVNFHNLGDTLFQSFSLRNKLVILTASWNRPRGLLDIKPNSDEFVFEYQYLSESYIVKGRKLDD